MNVRFLVKQSLVSLFILIGMEFIIGLLALKIFVQTTSGISLFEMSTFGNWQAFINSWPGIIGGLFGLAWLVFWLYAIYKP